MFIFPRLGDHPSHLLPRAVHRAARGALRQSLAQRRSVSARVVVLALLVPALLMLSSTAPADAAIVKPFGSVFSTNTNGQIILRGNTNETCDTVYTAYSPNPPTPAAGSTACSEAQNGTTEGYNNQFNMKYVDVDSNASTFNSSSATIDVPSGSRVLYARLSWSGTRSGSTTANGAPDSTKSNQVKIQGPGASGYTTVTAADADVTTAGNNNAYGASADVTSYVAAQGAGSFTVADIQAGLGNDRYAGWSMAIAYSNPSEPVRNLTIFNGWGTITNGETLNIPVSGFQTPPAGTVDTRVGVAAFEGDRGLKGDQLSIDGGNGFQLLSNAVNPEANSFNSTVSQNGAIVGGRNPNYNNVMGEDVDRFNASGLLKNNQTAATLRLTSSGDVYYPQIVTFATELYAPKLTTTKTATDVNGGDLEPGDQIRYDIAVKNEGQDDATKSQLVDSIPTHTTYVPGSLSIGGSAVSDAADGDVGRFVADSNQGQVRANLGTGATGTAGGRVAVNATTTVSFLVTVDTDLFADTVVNNTASTSYEGAQTGLALSTSSNSASSTVTASRADLRVRTTAAKPVVQRGDTASFTAEVVNRGPKTAEGVSLANALPAGASVASITTDQGTCSATDASCDLGTIPVGGTVTVRFTLALAGNASDPSTVTSKVSSETIDPNPANDTSAASVGVNSPPTATGTTATTTNGSATVNVLRNASDPDGDTLSVSKAVVEPPANGTVVVNDDGTLTYTANPGFRGTDTITYTVSDGRGGTVTATLTVTVPNADPVAKDDDTAAAPTGATPIDVLGNDSDPNNTAPYAGQDTLTVQSTTQPQGGSVSIAGDGRSVSFTPNDGFKGTTTFQYTVGDGNGGTDTATVTVTVPNTAPEAADDDYTTPYATAKLLDVLKNDRDDNGDTLSIVPGSVGTPRSGGQDVGTATIENGQIRFTPNAGFSGVARFDYTISDGNGGTDTATVAVTVGNGAPTAGDGAATSDGGRIAIDVLQYASDPNGDPLTVTGITGVKNGSVVINDDGTVTYYTPTPGYKGQDSFDYTVSDGNGGTATGTITVTVNNQPPTAPDVRRSVPAGVPTTIPVLTGATDPNGDPLTITKVTDPAHGTLTFDGQAGTITYTPDRGYDGADVVTFTVSDGDGGTTTATLTVRGVNQAPNAVRDVTTVKAVQGGSATIDVLANDSDPNDDPLSICGFSTPAHGTAVVRDGKLVYTYDDDFAGSDVFSYTACDGRGGETTARVIVTVVNDSPVASPDTARTARNTPVTVDVLGNDSDPNGDALSVVSTTDPVGADGKGAGTTSIQDGKVVFTPTRGFTGAATFDYRMRDARGAIATATVTVDVANSAPTARDVATTTPYDTTVSLSPDASDPDGDDLTLTTVGTPTDTNGKAQGTATIVGGVVSYDPPAGFSGKVTFPYTVSDGLQTASATMTVAVGPGITSGSTRTIASDGVPGPVTTSGPGSTTVTLASGTLPPGLTLKADGTFTRADGTTSKPGTYPVTVRVCDDSTPPLCSTQDLTITVDNKAPVAGDVAVSTPYDQDRTVDVVRTPDNPDGVAYDPDNDALTLTVDQPTSGGKDVGTATVVDGKIVFDPPAGFSGTVTIPYTVSDGTASSSGTITVTVGPAITSGPTRSIPAGGTPDPVATSGPGTATVSLTKGPLPGGLTLNPDGTFTRAAGTTSKPGTYPVTVQVCDDSTPALCSTQDLTITIQDTAPTAKKDSRSVDFGTASVSFDAATGKADDLAADPDGDALTVSKVTQPQDADGKDVGTASIGADGTVVFTPPATFSGTVTFDYTVTDGEKTATATLTVTVANGTPKVTANTTQSIKIGQTPTALTLVDPNGDATQVTVLPNVSDDTGSPASRLPTGVTLNKDGTWSGKATAKGSYVSRVQVCDDRDPQACSTSLVTIDVEDTAPAAVDDKRTTPAGTAVTIPVTRNDDDPDGDPLTVTNVTAPRDRNGNVVGKATIAKGGTSISYVPPVGFRGPVTMTYTVSDGTETSTATVTIDVANAAPKVTSGTQQTIQVGSRPTRLGSTDANGDPTTVRVVGGSLPPGLRLGTDGTWRGRATDTGTYRFRVQVCDNQSPAACSTQVATVRVLGAGGDGGDGGGSGSGGTTTTGSSGSTGSSGGILPSTGASAALSWAGLAAIVLIAAGGGLLLRRRRDTEPVLRGGPRPVGGKRRRDAGARRGESGFVRLDVPRSAHRGRHQAGRHR